MGKVKAESTSEVNPRKQEMNSSCTPMVAAFAKCFYFQLNIFGKLVAFNCKLRNSCSIESQVIQDV